MQIIQDKRRTLIAISSIVLVLLLATVIFLIVRGSVNSAYADINTEIEAETDSLRKLDDVGLFFNRSVIEGDTCILNFRVYSQYFTSNEWIKMTPMQYHRYLFLTVDEFAPNFIEKILHNNMILECRLFVMGHDQSMQQFYTPAQMREYLATRNIEYSVVLPEESQQFLTNKLQQLISNIKTTGVSLKGIEFATPQQMVIKYEIKETTNSKFNFKTSADSQVQKLEERLMENAKQSEEQTTNHSSTLLSHMRHYNIALEAAFIGSRSCYEYRRQLPVIAPTDYDTISACNMDPALIRLFKH